jgi:putative serine protease PepD
MPFEEEPDDLPFSRPLPPEDRIWRHPSELGGAPPDRTVGRAAPGRRAAARTWLVVLASAFVGAGTTLVALSLTGALDDDPTTITAVEQVQIPVPKTPSSSDLAVGESVHPAVARVDATGPDGTSSGTAIVFRSDGHLLTTADAVAAGGTLVVTFSDGTSTPATVVGADDAQDVAVVRVGLVDLPTATLAMEPTTTLGDRTVVVSAGARWPDDRSVGVGVVSGLDRWVEVPGAPALHGMVQANVGLDHAATGAALVDVSGAVIGLITRKGTHGDDERTGNGRSLEVRYAIPTGWAKHLADEIVEEGRTSAVWLGVEGTDATEEEAEVLGGRGGAKVSKVAEASPAEAAGVQPGDIVTAIDDDDVTSMSELIVALRTHDDGDPVAIEVQREGSSQTVVAALVERPSDG